MPVSDSFYNVEVQKICAISDEWQEFRDRQHGLKATNHPGRLRTQVGVIGRTNERTGSHV
jgi:hypothetical protein